MIAEYVDIQGGSRLVNISNRLQEILEEVRELDVVGKQQRFLQELTVLGLSIAMTVTVQDLQQNQNLEHRDLDSFLSSLGSVNKINWLLLQIKAVGNCAQHRLGHHAAIKYIAQR